MKTAHDGLVVSDSQIIACRIVLAGSLGRDELSAILGGDRPMRTVQSLLRRKLLRWGADGFLRTTPEGAKIAGYRTLPEITAGLTAAEVAKAPPPQDEGVTLANIEHFTSNIDIMLKQTIKATDAARSFTSAFEQHGSPDAEDLAIVAAAAHPGGSTVLSADRTDIRYVAPTQPPCIDCSSIAGIKRYDERCAPCADRAEGRSKKGRLGL